MEWLGIGHTRIKHSPQVNWDQSTRSLLGCLKDPLISGLIQNISFEINWNLFSACQVLVAFPYIYLRSHAGVVLDRGQCAMCVVGHVTHYIQGVVRGRFTSRHQGSLRTSKIKTAVRRNWVARAYVSIGVPPSWRLGLITRSNLHSSLCFRRVVCWFSCTQLFLSLGAGVLKEVVSSALSAAAQDVLLQL